MPPRYEIGQNIIIPRGVEVNHGLNEDSDSFRLLQRLRAVVVGFAPGAIEVVFPGKKDLSPAFWHQPEPRSSTV